MIKIKFIGQTDDDFTNNEIYHLINFFGDINYIYAFITNDNNEISCIPYRGVESFNDNWEVVNND